MLEPEPEADDDDDEEDVPFRRIALRWIWENEVRIEWDDIIFRTDEW